MRRRYGFTRVELIVVVVVIAVLIAILLPSLAPEPAPARRAACAVNLKTQGSALLAYAADYSDSIPVFPTATTKLASLCQQTLETRNALVSTIVFGGMGPATIQKNFFCPANAEQDPARLWDAGGVSTWGYVWMNDRGVGGATLPTTFPARKVPLEYVSDLSKVRRPDETTLALDVIVTDTDAAPLNYTPKGVAVDFGTNHVTAGKPMGANMVFADAHVEWVQFDAKTTVAVKQPGGGYFWFPGP